MIVSAFAGGIPIVYDFDSEMIKAWSCRTIGGWNAAHFWPEIKSDQSYLWNRQMANGNGILYALVARGSVVLAEHRFVNPHEASAHCGPLLLNTPCRKFATGHLWGFDILTPLFSQSPSYVACETCNVSMKVYSDWYACIFVLYGKVGSKFRVPSGNAPKGCNWHEGLARCTYDPICVRCVLPFQNTQETLTISVLVGLSACGAFVWIAAMFQGMQIWWHTASWKSLEMRRKISQSHIPMIYCF